MENLYNRIACAEEDRISNLPYHLIDLVLELLPIQDAVRTSILSKKWLYRWTTMPSLVFDERFFKKFAKNGAFGPNGFIRIINRVLFFHKGPISKFHLDIPNIEIDSLQEVDEWILMLSRKDVREFILANLNHRYRLPSFVFSCLELRKLTLRNCIMKPSLGFQGFPNLKYLRLHLIDFEATSGGSVINLPQLEQLVLYKCTNVHNFNVKARKLHTLIVIDSADVTSLTLFHGQCLTTVGMFSSKPTQGSPQVDKMIVGWMSRNIPNLKFFWTNGYFLKFYIAEYISNWHPLTFNSLKHLVLINVNFGDVVQLQAALCMLRNLPSLEILRVRNGQNELGDVHLDAQPTSYCLDQPLKQLQTVKIESAQGSQAELLFVKLLLDHSPTLKKMSIILGTTIDAHKKHSFAMDVMRFSRRPQGSVELEILIDEKPITTKYSCLGL